jgi:hypothetical protein
LDFRVGEKRVKIDACIAAGRLGVGGGRQSDQEECGTAKHGPDTESGSRDTSGGPHKRKAVAERFLIDLKERLAKFALSLHPEKTRLLEFGRYAAERRRAERSQASRKRSIS